MQSVNFKTAICLGNNNYKALDVRLRGQNIYVHWAHMVHTSYHASGQWHIKRERRYVLWRPFNDLEPMREFKTPPALVTEREKVSVAGWEVGKVSTVLPLLSQDEQPGLVVGGDGLQYSTILGFEVSVVGSMATPRQNILGFPVIGRATVTGDVQIEIEAFRISEADVGASSGNGDL